jgi:cell division protein FtsL
MLRYTGNTEVLDTRVLDSFDVDEAQRARSARRRRERIIENKDPNNTASKRGSWPMLIILAAGALAAFFLFLHGDIELNQVNREIAAAEIRLAEAGRENTRLRTSLDSMATPSRVEEFAAENGLVREQVLQVTHVSVNIESVIEVAEEPKKDFLTRLGDRLDEILEFLGLA